MGASQSTDHPPHHPTTSQQHSRSSSGLSHPTTTNAHSNHGHTSHTNNQTIHPPTTVEGTHEPTRIHATYPETTNVSDPPASSTSASSSNSAALTVNTTNGPQPDQPQSSTSTTNTTHDDTLDPPLSVVLEFASDFPPALLRASSTSASTFAQLHSSIAQATSTNYQSPHQTPMPSPLSNTLTVSPPHSTTSSTRRLLAAASFSPESLSSVSEAIYSGLNSLGVGGSFTTNPATPQTPSLLTQDTKEQKSILLNSLFQAIDRDSNGYLEREQLLNWIEHEPWLKQDSLMIESQRMIDAVSHDEDSRVSKNEFMAAFETFSASDIITLIVNLLRAGMVSKVPKITYVSCYNSHDPYLNGAPDLYPEVSPDPGAHSELSVHDTPAHTLMFGQSRTEAEKHFFLLDVLFQAMDRDLDGELDVKDLTRWLRADPWIHERDNGDIFQAVDSCWRELVARNFALGFVQPQEQPISTTMAGSSQSVPAAAVGPAHIDKHFFFLMFSQVPKKNIRKLLVHLLSRNASTVMEDAATARKEKIKKSQASVPIEGVTPAIALVTLQPPSSTTALPRFPYPLVRKHSVVTGGAKRISVADGLRVTLVGQAMIQHDLRQSQLGLQTLKEMAPLLKADVVFTELETSLVRHGRHPEQLRNTVFFHAAEPEVVDCLVAMGFNMYATSNNHSGDLGEEGIRTIMEEFSNRKLCMGGIGIDACHAARASFLNTPNGRIAQICFASKIPESSIARENKPGVNSLSMVDVDTHTLNPVELNRILLAIEQARDGFFDHCTHEQIPKADMIIAYHHNHYWEKNASVNQEGAFGAWKRELAHRMIDAGAHVYVAHGDPRLQGIEIYRGSPIFYCLGNFIFQTKTALNFYGAEVWQSVMVHLHCNDIHEATSYSVKLIPVVLNEQGETDANHLQTRGLPRLASRQVGQQILHKLQEMSRPFGTTITIEETIEGDPNSPLIGWVLGANANKNLTHQPLGDSVQFNIDGVEDHASEPTIDSSSRDFLGVSDSNLKAPTFIREISPQAATFVDEFTCLNRESIEPITTF